MALPGREEQGISWLLKNALVADLVFEVADQGFGWIDEPLKEPFDWTGHLARQLGDLRRTEENGLHETLLFVLRELDPLLRRWPPPTDEASYRTLAHEATKSLTEVEVYASFWGGPPRWRQRRIGLDCTVEALPGRLQPILEQVLAGDLQRLVERWVGWDVRLVREKREQAREARFAAERALGTPARTPGSRTERRRPTPEEIADYPRERYQPPGRT